MNVAILQPDWLIRQGIVREEDAEALARVNPSIGVAQTTYKTGQYLWSVAPTRLVVHGLEPDASPGSFVAAVMGKLKHTPVDAVGSNCFFEVPAGVGQRVWAERYTIRLPGGVSETLLAHEIRHRFEYDESVVTIKLAASGETIESVDFNFNRPVSSSSDAVLAANKWQNDCVHAEMLMTDIFGDIDADNRG